MGYQVREKSSSFFGYVKTMSESSDMKWQNYSYPATRATTVPSSQKQ